MVSESEEFPGMVGRSAAMEEVYDLTRRVARSNATVLLLGETGTGKELVARAVHQLSDRASGPFVRVNCGALSESLLESELFGHVKGAFTTAVNNRTGRFEAGHGGTIFLDEINSVSLTMQVKLLRVLQEQEFERVGDSKTIKVDVRIVAATNRNLTAQIDEGSFREDLYYRLNVVSIYLPALRQRVDDIPELATHFLSICAARNGRHVTQISAETMATLQRYDWPGNVRELENYIERSVVLARDETVTPDLLPPHVRGESGPQIGPPAEDDSFGSLCRQTVQQGLTELTEAGQSDRMHERMLAAIERELIRQTLEACHGTQTRTASKLGINRNTLHKKIDEYGLHDGVR